MWPICNMVWRIGRILPVREQIEWCRAAGFDGIGLHASRGFAEAWQGVEPADCSPAQRSELRKILAAFAMCEVHAPFASVVTAESLHEVNRQLAPVFEFAGDIGAKVVTVHADLPENGTFAADEWREVMTEMDGPAGRHGLLIGLELLSGFERVREWNLPHIGITLDVGHMHIINSGAHLAPFGTLGNLVRRIGAKLVHLHMHDVEQLDHLEIGVGRIDFQELLAALHDIGYSHGMCLEMNPDRVSEDGIRRSLRWLRQNTGRGTPS